MDIVTLSRPASRIDASIRIPGSKSYTNRALIIASLASGTSRLTNASLSTDSDAMIAALRHLGVKIEVSGGVNGTTLTVVGSGGDFHSFKGTIDVGPAGTTMRFLTALCAGIPGIDVVLCGTERMHRRPIRELVTALQSLGAEIEYLGDDGCPPLRIRARSRPTGGTVAIDGSISSQFISALLLTSPLYTQGLKIEAQGELTSRSYVEMTLQSLADFGLKYSHEDFRRFEIKEAQRLVGREYPIEGDASGASYLWGIAAISGGSIRVENLNPHSAQGDIHFPQLLEEMGCTVQSETRAITVHGCSMNGSPKLRGITADMILMPDTAQTLAVIAACAKGSTSISGLHTLRIKETDRIAALQNELQKMHIRSRIGPADIVVEGGAPIPARIKTYEDHRMAMSFAMLGSVLDGVEIEEPHVVEKSYPNFWDTLRSLGMGID